MNLKLLVAVAPAIIIIMIVSSFDKFEKEPSNLLLSLFVYGCVMVVPALVLEKLLVLHYSSKSFYTTMLDTLIIAAVEESVKYLPARFKAYNQKSFNEIYDGILYCVFIALGFATIENIMYVMASGMTAGLLRAVTAVPAHAMFGVFMGYYLSNFKAYKSHFASFLSLAAPIALHWVYDLILFMEADWALIAFLPYVVWMYFVTVRKIIKTSSLEPFDFDDDPPDQGPPNLM